MKRMRFWLSIIAYCILVQFLFTACGSISNKCNSSEVSMKVCYSKENFKSITIGESTYKDVYDLAPFESMQITSYGGVIKIPLQTGGYILIKFYGEELIVGSIEEISSP